MWLACAGVVVRVVCAGVGYKVPDGSPCLHGSDAPGERTGFCYAQQCSLAEELATVPTCGNGGVDFGEQCDCGEKADDPAGCCDCATCKLAAGKACATIGWLKADQRCCDSSKCSFTAKGTVCRAAVGSCDADEVCSGASNLCPFDSGKPIGTKCKASGADSTCYARRCVKGLSEQCAEVTGRKGAKHCLGSECDVLACYKEDGRTCSKQKRAFILKIRDMKGKETQQTFWLTQARQLRTSSHTTHHRAHGLRRAYHSC